MLLSLYSMPLSSTFQQSQFLYAHIQCICSNHQANLFSQCKGNMQTHAQSMPGACEHSQWVWPPVGNCMVMVLWCGTTHMKDQASTKCNKLVGFICKIKSFQQNTTTGIHCKKSWVDLTQVRLLEFQCCDLHNNQIWCCSCAITQYKINWLSVQSVVKFICLLQVGAIFLQYSHDDVIGQSSIHCVVRI